MKIIFQSNQIGELGTEVALYDYAHYNEEILGNESYILTKKKHAFPHNDNVIRKFKKRFGDRMFFYKNWDEAEEIMKDNNIEALYAIKAGNRDGVISRNPDIKNLMHVVFQYNEPHGDVYAYISEWLSKNVSNGKYPFVPHMINLPDVEGDLREKLNIPKNAIVFGRYGNRNSFNLPFVINSINKLVEERKDIYFLFANTSQKSPQCRIPLKRHERIIMYHTIIDLEEKVKFINTCDAMLHARINGESFGISIGEFSVKNKPVFTWSGSNHKRYWPHKHDLCHIDILKDKGIIYDDHNIYSLLNNFRPDPSKDWDAYSELYSPYPVMQKFKRVFLDDEQS